MYMMSLFLVCFLVCCKLVMVWRSDVVPYIVTPVTLSPSFLLAQAIFEPNLFPCKYPTILNPSHSTPTHPPMKMEQTECSETSAYKIQMLRNYPEESIQHSEHGESLKSRQCLHSHFIRVW